ncbi:solute carrier family 41 member 1-like [Paramacrobiotus metropolitanus]|uniref:solute carrier family 41 member 1-like n=1 Tax=Paramacrobiotus metropolitanus TaxID=2943436 RepID=UPI002445ED65|nr:solute carrier family 41 member 1-like [Paramacrobiotus metropolitanus]
MVAWLGVAPVEDQLPAGRHGESEGLANGQPVSSAAAPMIAPIPIPLPRPVAASSFDGGPLPEVNFRNGGRIRRDSALQKSSDATTNGVTIQESSAKPPAAIEPSSFPLSFVPGLSSSPVVRYFRRRNDSARVGAAADTRQSDEESIISTESSTICITPDGIMDSHTINSQNVLPGRRVGELDLTVPKDNLSVRDIDLEGGGVANESFSCDDDEGPHPVHIDAGLPPVDVVEDVCTAAKMPNDIPIIDALVVEGVHIGKEKLKGLVLQIFIPFLLAGFGMVGAGVLLDAALKWTVFTEISEIVIMVPALLGLKGNLEMTLASRLSTQVNIGGFDVPRRKWKIIGCNMALNQVLATGVGFMASLFAVIVHAIKHHGQVETQNVILMLGTAMLSACSTSIIQDSIMIATVLFAKRFRLNPDNIATPVAGTIGDVLTLSILAGFSYLFYSAFKTSYAMLGPIVAICCLTCLAMLWVWVARQESSTRHVLIHGWVPVVAAMLISSCAGLIIEQVNSTSLGYFKGLSTFVPLINGVGGNIVSVQASRIATYLHLAYTHPGHIPPGYTYLYSPCHSFCSRSNVNARTARLLLLMVVPGHLIFLFTISFVHTGSTSISLSLRFAVVFLVMALIQVAVLLYVADILTHFVWMKGLDPDSQTIPYLTALGDLLGTGLLAFAFWLKGDSVGS